MSAQATPPLQVARLGEGAGGRGRDVSSLLARHAPTDTALIANGKATNYGDLTAAIDASSVPTGAVVALVGDFNLPTVSALFALWNRGCTVVPMLTLNKIRCEIAKVEYIVENGKTSPLPSGGEGPGVRGKEPFDRHPSDERESPSPLPLSLGGERGLYAELTGPGLVLFTSGSTGTPKAALHDVSRWLEKLSRPGRRQRTLAFLSFDHIGGLNTLLYALANGGSIVAPTDRSPAAVWEAIQNHNVELLPTTPTFLRLALLDGPIPPLPSLKLIAYGSEPMPDATLEAIKKALPNVDFLQQYGMSELGVLRSRSRDDGSTWVRLGGPEFEVRVVDGLLQVKADTAMLGYLNAPSPFTPDGWLQTGDEAEQDGEWLRIKGRRAETINVGGEKVHPTEVEACLESLDGVDQAVVRGDTNPITGQIVVAAVRLATTESIEEFRTRMRTELKGKIPRHAIPQRIERLTGGINERGKKNRSADAPSAGGPRTPRPAQAA